MEMVSQYNTEAQTKFVIESRGDCFNDYYQEHHIYEKAIDSIYNSLKKNALVQILDRKFLPNYIFGSQDIIVVVGQDGLVANTLKYLNGQKTIAVNPDPSRYDGVLLPFEVKDVEKIALDVSLMRRDFKLISMAEVNLSDGQSLLAVNDFFIGPDRQTSARYEITHRNKTEYQSSSGIIISTGLGSTGWMSSILTGAQGIIKNNKNKAVQNPSWDSDHLVFAVREPFPSNATKTSIITGECSSAKPLIVSSKMALGGVIFSDGVLDDFLEFNSGATATIGLSNKKGLLVT